MSRPHLYHIATRSSGISPTTLNHVLGLVQRSPFLVIDGSPNRSLSSSARSDEYRGDRALSEGSASISGRSRSFLTPSDTRRCYSSQAHAVEPVESDPLVPFESTPAPKPSSSRPSSSSVLRSLRYNNFESAVRFRAAFEELDCSSTDLRFVLPLISKLFLRTATRADWHWLERQLVELCRSVRNGRKEQERISHYEARSILALAQATAGRWEEARTAMGMAIRLILKHDRAELPTVFRDCWGTYTKLVELQHRQLDFIEIFRHSGTRLRSLLISQQSDAPEKVAICDVFNQAFRSIPDPSTRLAEEFEHEDTTDAKSRKLGMAIFAALVRDPDRLEDAALVHDFLRSAGTYCSPGDSSLYLSRLGRARLFDKAVGVYEELAARYDTLSHSVLLRALEMFAQSGQLEAATSIWDSIRGKSPPSRRDILAYAKCFATLGRVDETREILSTELMDQSMEKDIQALDVLLTAHLRAHESVGAEVCLRRMSEIKPSLSTFNRLLSYYTQTGNSDAAISTFDSILQYGLEPNIASYTTLISLFGNRRDAPNAANIFQAMVESGIQPDAVALAAILNAEVESGSWVDASLRWGAAPAKLKNDPQVLTVILKAFVLLGSPIGQTLTMFRRIPKPSSHAWSLVIQSASDSGDLGLARDLFEEMDKAAEESAFRPAPGLHTFTILLHGYLRMGDGTSARHVYDEMQSRNIVPSSVTYGVIVRSFSTISGGASMDQAEAMAMSILEEARQGRVFETAKSRGKLKENLMGPLITSSAAANRIADAQSYFNLAATQNEQPSVPMYTKLMDAYRRVGDVDTVLTIWDKVYSQAIASTSSRIDKIATGLSIAPLRNQSNILCIPLSIAMDALSAVGRYFDVKNIWHQVKEAGFGFDSHNYNHYAVALARTGDVEAAFRIVETVLLPRSDDVIHRRQMAMRETVNYTPLAQKSQTDSIQAAEIEAKDETIADLPVDPPQRPPNRRHENREDLPGILEDEQSPRGYDDQAHQEKTARSASEWLKFWRPVDITWKPSLLTVAVLEHAYTQIEAKRGVWIGLGTDEGEGESDFDADVDANGQDEAGQGDQNMVLPDFGGVTIKDRNGKTNKSSPVLFLAKLNRKYARTVALIMLHRKKHARADQRR